MILTATPAAGWSFSSWSGDLAGTTNPQSITMNGDKNVTATFTLNTYALNITITGTGTVKCDIDPPYHYGDVVTLTANAATGWSFSAWSGDLIGTPNPQSITMDADKSVTATFVKSCNLTVSAGNDATVYLGYAPMATTQLNAVVTGGTSPFTYTWSPSLGLSDGYCVRPEVRLPRYWEQRPVHVRR